MKNLYSARLESIYDSKTFKRKVDYIKYNFGPIVQKLKTKKKVSTLEIGPGKGEFISYLQNNGIKDIDIIDNDKSVLSSLNENYEISNIFHSNDIVSVNSKLRRYDLIILVQVLEHMSPKVYFSVVKTLYSKLNKNGYILIVVPNANNPLGLTERYGDLQHRNSFTEQSLNDLVIGSAINNYDDAIKGYLIPPYSLVNIIRIILQKMLHLFLLGLMIINGGTYFKIMNPNISLIINKRT